jgi:hypothetical protein
MTFQGHPIQAPKNCLDPSLPVPPTMDIPHAVSTEVALQIGIHALKDGPPPPLGMLAFIIDERFSKIGQQSAGPQLTHNCYVTIYRT